eukprot:TRINITY_DN45156_c0_g1_i1.p1 TRINITY_DN45156_c0_g1~~TRINITY_DN45156_c0_g1_i1.p1  ORF type:complete len:244 (+),score=43.27 TRINITY_DN45156_c0_g1_i1:92-823(+)
MQHNCHEIRATHTPMRLKLLRPAAAPVLTYLNFPGIAEPIRLVLHMCGVPFVDERIDHAEVARRRSLGLLPGGQVPVLRVQGCCFSQSSAILRWAAVEGGMDGDCIQQLRCGMVEAALQDIQIQLRPQWYGTVMGRSPVTGEPVVPLTEAQQEEVLRRLDSEVLPAHFGRLEKVLVAAGGEWFCGKEISTADLSFYVMGSGMIDGSFCAGISQGVLDEFPKLTALIRRVSELPSVKSWEQRNL